MKIGHSGFLYLSAFLAGVATSVLYYAKKNKILFDNVVINETKNFDPSGSFIEFFDKDSIKEAYSRYEKYIDLGLNKHDAFKAVVEDDRNI